MAIGIYSILNIVNGKQYIGSSINIENRLYHHFYDLKLNKHCNPYLQNSWKKYSNENFHCSIIEECDEAELIKRESYYIQLFETNSRQNGYNIMKAVGDSFRHSEESLLKIGRASKERGVPKHVTDNLKLLATGEGNPYAKLSNDDIQNIRFLIKSKLYHVDLIALSYDVTVNTLSSIINNKSWTHLMYVEPKHFQREIFEERLSAQIETIKRSYSHLLSEVLLRYFELKQSPDEISNLVNLSHSTVLQIIILKKHGYLSLECDADLEKKQTYFYFIPNIQGDKKYTVLLTSEISDKVKEYDMNLRVDESICEIVDINTNINICLLGGSGVRAVTKVYYLDGNCLNITKENILIKYYSTKKNSKNVRYRKDRKCYQAYISLGKQFKSIGHYKSEDEAHNAVINYFEELEQNKSIKNIEWSELTI